MCSDIYMTLLDMPCVFTDSDMHLVGYIDSDWAGSVQDRNSTSKCCFNLGSVVISWCSRKQTSVALSSAETEYIAACMAAREAVWLRKLLVGLSGHMLEPTVIHCDNQNCVQMSLNLVHHDQTKHVEMRYHYVQDMVQRHAVELQFVPTDEQVADVLTKLLVRGKFEGFQKMLTIIDDVSLIEMEC